MLKRGNSKLKTNKPLKRGGKIKPGKSIKKVGKKSKEWSKARKELLEDLEILGIEKTCEVVYDGCLGSMFLTLAHSLRRRKIETEDELKQVIYACSQCHEKLDALPQEETERIVKEIIRNRNNA